MCQFSRKEGWMCAVLGISRKRHWMTIVRQQLKHIQSTCGEINIQTHIFQCINLLFFLYRTCNTWLQIIHPIHRHDAGNPECMPHTGLDRYPTSPSSYKSRIHQCLIFFSNTCTRKPLSIATQYTFYYKWTSIKVGSISTFRSIFIPLDFPLICVVVTFL